MKTTSIIVHQTMSIDCPYCGHYINDTYEKEIFNKLIDTINEIEIIMNLQNQKY